MLGIISIIALIVWGICRVIKRNKVAPSEFKDDPQNYQST